MTAIGLLGDVMLGRSVAEALADAPPEEVWAPELRQLARSWDGAIANLECCISTRGEPTSRVAGKPFFFRAPAAGIASLEALSVRVVGVANNHALDYETDALEDTLEQLDDAGIVATGAGRGERQARRGAVVSVGDLRVGLAAVSDHPVEFAAGPQAPGIAYADLERGVPEWLEAELERLRRECDVVVAFPHWGPNMTTSPARWQRRAAEQLQAAGADLVAGHSAHVFHGVGWGERGPVLYDLGDALDDYAVDAELRNDLGVAAVWRPGTGDAELELVGLRLDYCLTRFAAGPEAEWIAERLDAACSKLGTSVERVAEQRFVVRPA
jgi:poly-gamma-glutamate capsule biosynthesis protein CapA/YwtB (metallophosphatase superfamily)